jgi:branched-subunit amino acid ABC-type transport system permease component
VPFRAGRAWRLIVLGPGLGLVLFALLALLGGLGGGADREQGRLCRLLLPALVPQSEGIMVLEAERGSGSSVHIVFQAGGRKRLLTCRFGGIGYSAAKRDLGAVQLDGTGLGEATMFFLKEVWLESPASIAADPGPPRSGAPLELPRPAALALQHLVGGLPRLANLMLLALATALIYGLIGRINLAFGEFAAMGGIAASLVIAALATFGATNPAFAAFAAILVALALTGFHGAVMGGGVIWPLAFRAGQPILVVGVALLIVIQEGLRLSQGTGTRWLPPVAGEAWRIAAAPGFEVLAHPRVLSMSALGLAAITGVLIMMRASRFGRAWRASADDAFAASLCGIDPRRMLVATSALATALAGLAGATITLNYGGMNFAGGTMLGLTALIAAILGGIGSLGGAVAGGLLIGLFQIGWSALQPIAHWELATFALLTLALALRPSGLFGRNEDANWKARP